MEKRMVSIMLATSMAFLLLAGCGGSGNTGAAATAEAADETETAEEKDVPEEKTAEDTLITAELKRCADELASTDLSMQTIRDMIRG